MNRPSTAVLAVLEALLVVGIGVGLPVAVLSLLWGFQYGLQIDWIVFWRAAVDVWLVGHGVDLTLTLAPEAAAATGLPGAEAPVQVTLAALGFAVLTAVLGARAGRAVAETPHRVLGAATAIATLAVLATLLTLSARHESALPSLPQGIVLPTLVYAVPLLVAAEVTRRRRGAPADPVTAAVGGLLARVPAVVLHSASAALRLGTAATAVVLAVSGVVVAVLLVTSYAELITLYEGAHAGLLGGIALTLGQLALLPTIVVWAASWFVGPGFAVGTGSSVSPLGTTVGPMPAVPFLGALPTGDSSFGFVGLLVPVVGAFVAATLLRPRVVAALGRHDDALRRALVGVAAGVVGGALLGLLSWAASGAAGPGRLVDVGPDPLLVGAFAALEIALPAALALAVDPRAFFGGGDDDLVGAGAAGDDRATSARDAGADHDTAGGAARHDPEGAARRGRGLRWPGRGTPARGDGDDVVGDRDVVGEDDGDGGRAAGRADRAPVGGATPARAHELARADVDEPDRPRVRLHRASERAALADAATDEIAVVDPAAAERAARATGAHPVTPRRGGADAQETDRIEGLDR